MQCKMIKERRLAQLDRDELIKKHERVDAANMRII